MDKLRAYRYFCCAAREGSLSAAARQLDVSVAAVSKLIASLERELGTPLFDRGAQGLTLTAAGSDMLEACEPALASLDEAEASFGRGREQRVGTVAIAAQHLIAFHCLMPALDRFRTRFPGIALDVRDFAVSGSPDSDGADLRLSMTWDEPPDEVSRTLARTRMVICAAPQYWARFGVPQRPKDLERHVCFSLRAVKGTLMDHWPLERDGVREDVVAKGWLSTSNTNRDLVVGAALAGMGVVRSIDFAIEPYLRDGRLVPVLLDWQTVDSPHVRLRYRPSAARLPRVRATIDFLAELFRDVERRVADVAGERPRASAPTWVGTRYFRRASSAAAVAPEIAAGPIGRASPRGPAASLPAPRASAAGTTAPRARSRGTRA